MLAYSLVACSLLLVVIVCADKYAPSSSKGQLFYIYDWPHLVDRYANFTDRGHHGHGVEIPFWKYNHGMGRLTNLSNHEYRTSQFSLFKIFYERALIDPHRTMDPEKATTFVIPYDFGMDATFTEQHGRMRRTQCPLATDVMKLLNSSKYFNQHYGHNHVLINAVNQNMNYFFTAKACASFFQFIWNVTKLSIDEYMFIAKNRPFELGNRGINWHAIPFPSDYHYTSLATQLPPWTRSNSEESRPILISFIGNARKYSVVSTSIREALLAQCQNHTNACVHSLYAHSTLTQTSTVDAKATADSDNNNGGLNYAQNAVFCLQPPGDMPTRKSVFDVILAGCIPVFFHPLTATLMYEWHLSEEEWEAIGVHYDSNQNNTDLIQHRVDFIQSLIDLATIYPKLIQQKQESIRQLAYRLQYSAIIFDNATQTHSVSRPITFNTTATSSTDANSTGEGMGMMLDAYDISMQQVLLIHAGKSNHDRRSSYASCMQIKGPGKVLLQTAEWCNNTHSNKDPWSPASTISYFSHNMKSP